LWRARVPEEPRPSAASRSYFVAIVTPATKQLRKMLAGDEH